VHVTPLFYVVCVYFTSRATLQFAGLVSEPFTSNGVIIGRAETVLNATTDFEMAFDTIPFEVNATLNNITSATTLGSVLFPAGAVNETVKLHAGSQSFVEDGRNETVNPEETAPAGNFKWGNYTFSIVAEASDGTPLEKFTFEQPIIVVLHYNVEDMLSAIDAADLPDNVSPQDAFMPNLRLYDVETGTWQLARDSCPQAQQLETFDYFTRTYTVCMRGGVVVVVVELSVASCPLVPCPLSCCVLRVHCSFRVVCCLVGCLIFVLFCFFVLQVHVCHLTQFGLFYQQLPVLDLAYHGPAALTVDTATSEAWMLTAHPDLDMASTGQSDSVVRVITTSDPSVDLSLDASASYDPDGTLADVEWELLPHSCATPPALTISAAGDVVNVTASDFCVFGVRVTLRDDDGGETTRAVFFRVNQPPVAAFTIFDPITTHPMVETGLDSSPSTDLEGVSLSVQWDVPVVPERLFAGLGTQSAPAQLTDAVAPVTIFGVLDSPGLYVVTLTVDDGEGGRDTVNATFFYNIPPQANVVYNKTLKLLNGSSSFDNGGDIVSFVWTVVEARAYDNTTQATADAFEGAAGRSTAFSTPFGASTFFLPTLTGTYLVSLNVTDDLGASTVTTEFVFVGMDPTPCIPGEWSEWGNCTVECGGGWRSRKREEAVPASWGGEECVLDDTEACNVHVCETDCEQSMWSPWSACDPHCAPGGVGEQARYRSILVEPSPGGVQCGPPEQLASCLLDTCQPGDCVVSEWSLWGECSAQCGVLDDGSAVGMRSRSRIVLSPPAAHGRACPVLTQTAPCNAWPCPMQCLGCLKKSSGPCRHNNDYSCVELLTDSLQCPSGSTRCRAEECVVSQWTEWTQCPACGVRETRTRRRIVIQTPEVGMPECPELVEEAPCVVPACDVDCVMGEWGAWGDCDAFCGVAQQHRERAEAISSFGNGRECNETVTEERVCGGLPTCTELDCLVSEWSSWTCAGVCGLNNATRVRTVVRPGQPGGLACPALEELRPCIQDECTQCEVGEWSDWGTCSETCGIGSHTRSRRVLVAPTGSEVCPETQQEQACQRLPCDSCQQCTGDTFGPCKHMKDGSCGPYDDGVAKTCPVGFSTCGLSECVVGAWGEWTNCSVVCGGGTSHRTRQPVTKPVSPDQTCPPLFETRVCNDHLCNGDPCIVSEWSAWGACSVACGNGVVARTRTVLQEPTDGSTCPPLIEEESCTQPDCGTCCVWCTCVMLLVPVVCLCV